MVTNIDPDIDQLLLDQVGSYEVALPFGLYPLGEHLVDACQGDRQLRLIAFDARYAVAHCYDVVGVFGKRFVCPPRLARAEIKSEFWLFLL